MTMRKINAIINAAKMIDSRVEVQNVTKNNGTVLHGLTIKQGNIAPVVYIDSFDESKTAKEIAKEIIAMLNNSMALGSDINTDDIANYEKIKHLICAKLVNKEKNLDDLYNIPFHTTPLRDLVAVFYVKLNESANAKITNELMKTWKVIADDEFYEMALDNTERLMPSDVTSMADILSKAGFDVDMSDIQFGQVVVTNKDKSLGAISILFKSTRQKLQSLSNDDELIILPSSIHELIVMKDEEANMTKEEASSMIQEINKTEVAADEVLSDHPYYYDPIYDKFYL